MLWSNVLDVLRGMLFVLAHWCGGSLGAAILVASAAVRVALMPLTLAATRRRLLRERALRDLAPELARVQRDYAGRPELAFAATKRLHDARGVPMVDRRGLFDSLLQAPAATVLYSVIRGASATGNPGGFLWIANLAKPDRMLALGAGLLAGAIARVTMTAPLAGAVAQVAPLIITTAVTFLILSHMSAGLALYSITNSLIGGVERVIAVRTLRPAAA